MSQDLIKALRTARIMHNADQQELVCLPPADFKVIRDHIDALSRHRSSVESVELPEGVHGTVSSGGKTLGLRAGTQAVDL